MANYNEMLASLGTISLKRQLIEGSIPALPIYYRGHSYGRESDRSRSIAGFDDL